MQSYSPSPMRDSLIYCNKAMSNSLERGLDILELLASRGELRLGEVVKELGTSRATAFRMLATLQSRGYVEHVRSGHIYRLGSAVKGLAAQSDASSIVDLAAPAMEHLRAATSETINLALARRGRIVYGAILEGAYALRMAATVGTDVPPHAAALGKAVLASLPLGRREAYLPAEPYPAFTDRTITQRSGLEEELALTLVRGYAVDDEETEVGAACVAAPILGSDGVPVAAISVSGLAARMPDEKRLALGREVQGWCARISTELGYAPNTHATSAPGPP